PLGWTAHVGHDEADAVIKLSRMPFDLSNYPARLGPASGLIAEIGMEPAHMVRRSSDWAREQIADPACRTWVAGSRIAYLIRSPPETRRPRALQRPRPLENRCVRPCPGNAPRRA